VIVVHFANPNVIPWFFPNLEDHGIANQQTEAPRLVKSIAPPVQQQQSLVTDFEIRYRRQLELTKTEDRVVAAESISREKRIGCDNRSASERFVHEIEDDDAH
tara:strand:- start:6860 stop:7168 length:309 start_codon:yes stop_codon:yes gene_type:complete